MPAAWVRSTKRLHPVHWHKCRIDSVPSEVHRPFSYCAKGLHKSNVGTFGGVRMRSVKLLIIVSLRQVTQILVWLLGDRASGVNLFPALFGEDGTASQMKLSLKARLRRDEEINGRSPFLSAIHKLHKF